MKTTCRSLLISSLLFFSSYLSAADLDDQDIETLRDWINSRRMVTVKELGGQLSIAGDVHTEMQSTNEKMNGIRQRGYPGQPSTNSYDIEFNLSIDYRSDRTWGASRMRFDNDAGTVNELVGSGKNSNVKVDRAYFGYRIFDGNQHTMDVEMGRRPMSNVFDSKLEFGSNLDGIVFKDAYALEGIGDFSYQLAAFLVSERRNQMGYVGELVFQNIAGTGAYTKFSTIDWDTKDYPTVPSQFHFVISQLIMGYKFVPQVWDKLVHVYLAGLYNWRAHKLDITANKRSNVGTYLGVSVGQVKLKGDWAFEATYELAQAQCVPDFDTIGIGLGNSTGGYLYYTKSKDGTISSTTIATADGKNNFRGFELTLQYLISNNLNIFQQWSQSVTLDKSIGPYRQYKQYEIDFIYGF